DSFNYRGHREATDTSRNLRVARRRRRLVIQCRPPSADCLLPYFLPLPRLQKFCDTVVGPRERGLVGQEYDAKMSRARRLPEAAAVHHEDVFGDQQSPDELLVGPADIQAGEGVESASGSDRAQSRRA